MVGAYWPASGNRRSAAHAQAYLWLRVHSDGSTGEKEKVIFFIFDSYTLIMPLANTKPIAKLTNAAAMPMSASSSPRLFQSPTVIFADTAPAIKRTTKLATQEKMIALVLERKK